VSRRGALLAALALGMASLGWLDPSATPREAARLYADGKFDDAATKYNQALVDAPDSTLLHFNLGDAEYRRKQFEASARAFASLPQDAAAQYNQGNALYQMGVAAEQDKPQDALKHWAEALVAYRRAIATDPKDEDAKFNYEWVSRKIEELKKKLEEQQQKQDQQQNQQNQDQNKQDESQQDQEKQQQDQNKQDQADQQQKDEQQKDQQQAQDKPQDQQKPDDQQQAGQQPEQKPDQPTKQDQEQAQQNQQQPGGEEQQQAQGGDAQPAEGELSRDEATALLDGERNEELRPEDVIRRQLGTGEGPVQDW
jgi:Ca-activated chloride channel family protein